MKPDSGQTYTLLTRIKLALGPGLLIAGAAIGVSHLVQATRAGADFGFSIFWILIVAIITKYPFLEFGPRYAAATGSHLISGYHKLGKPVFNVFVFLTIGTMFIIQAAVTVVTAGLAEQLFGFGFSSLMWSLIILLLCALLLFFGRYPGLDISMKVIISLLTVLTLAAVVMALGAGAGREAVAIEPPSYWNAAGLAFIIAFMGWMPIPLDAAVWHSIWTGERSKQTRHRPSVRDSRIDFDIGYGSAAFIGVMFFLLGTLVMFGSGVSFSGNSVVFSGQLVDLYSQTLGAWSAPLISVAAFITMLSTTLAVTDAYPRVMTEIWTEVKHQGKENPNRLQIYRLSLVIIPVFSLLVLYFAGGTFTLLIDFAAGLSFVAAPVLGWFNYKLLTSEHTPEEARPTAAYRWFSLACLFFLMAFTLVWAWWRFFS